MRLGLAGDTMLGRGVAERLAHAPPGALVAGEVIAATREADLFVLNLECCVSERGQPWPDPDKPFFFRAPPVAVELLTLLGVNAVTCANNHALDFGPQALTDTLDHLRSAGIACVGAGRDAVEARRPAAFDVAGVRVGLVACTDHPADYAAGDDRPGVAYAPLDRAVPDWLTATVAGVDADLVVVTPHWGPNMTTAPVAHVRAAAPALLAAGAQLVAGHSAHVFHGVGAWPGATVLYDLGDFLDDYAVDPRLRNDLGLLWLVDVDGSGPTRVEAVPLALDFCHTRLATGADAAWIGDRLRTCCAELGTEVITRGGRLVVELR